MNSSPSHSLLGNLRTEIARFAPFAQMEPHDIDRFVAACEQAYYEPGEVLLSPSSGVVTHLLYIRRGSVSGRRGLAGAQQGGFEYEAGDLFPVGAAMGERAVTATYTANADTFCLLMPAAAMRGLARDCAPFADFLNRRVEQFLEISRRSLQAAYASQSLAEQSLETPLGQLVRRTAYGVAPHTPLDQALRSMHDRRIGSVLVLDESGRAQGILTRHDVLGRIALPGVALDTPIEGVMSSPVHTLDVHRTAQDAALLMSREGIRHVPVTGPGDRVVGIVSERDLFALQRLSLKQVSGALRGAADVEALERAAADIRRFARGLLGQGVRARQLTELISHLNDVLTERLVGLLAERHGIDLQRVCWLAFGSEGRSEQTIATDQDNGIAFVSDDPERDRPALLAFAREVNEALDGCGYPLCKGNVMAGNPDCCLTADEWRERFAGWIEHGAPEDLLNASIFFDFRPLAGQASLVEPMRAMVAERAARTPRFIKQMADNALRNTPALNWRGGIDAHTEQGHAVVDLKMRGTAIYVDAARVYALAHGVAGTSTRERFQAVAAATGAPPQEAEAWGDGFEYLQLLRLQVQLQRGSRQAVDAADGNENLIDVDALNDIDRRVLKESLRVARKLQQRMELDYRR